MVVVGVSSTAPTSAFERWKPLNVSQTPRENSHVAIGRARTMAMPEICSQAPNSDAVDETRRIGAPMRPMVGMMRGTSWER